MMPGMNPRQMKHMMKKMGIAQVEIDATQVIIKTPDTMLVFDDPQVSKVNMMGQETYQIVGTPAEQSLETTPEINDDDVKTVMEQTGATEEKARKAIEESNGDLAEAIMKLRPEERSEDESEDASIVESEDKSKD